MFNFLSILHVSFTYYSPLIRKVTSIQKHTSARISFKSTYTIHDLTKHITKNNVQGHKKCGIYELTCNTCKLSYVEQTNRSIKQGHQEHIRYIKQNDPQSAYAVHILNNNSLYGPSNITKSLLKQVNKTSLLIPYEQFCNQSHCYHNELIPEQSTGENSPRHQLIFDPRITSPPAIYTDQISGILPNSYTPLSNILFFLVDCLYWWYVQYSNHTLYHILRHYIAFIGKVLM